MTATATLEPPTAQTPAPAPQPQVPVERLGADRVLQEIQRHCLLVYVTVRRWKGQPLVRGASVSLGDDTVDHKLSADKKLATAPHWKIIPTDWAKALTEYERRARDTVRGVSVSFRDGVYIVPRSVAQDMIRRINFIKLGYIECVARFTAVWPDLLEQYRQKIGASRDSEVWRNLLKALPHTHELAKLHDIEVGLYPVSSGNLTEEHLVGLNSVRAMTDRAAARLETLRQSNEPVDTARLMAWLPQYVAQVQQMLHALEGPTRALAQEAAETYLDDARASTRNLVSQAVEAMVKEPVQEFAEAVSNLLERQRNRRCSEGTIDIVRRAYQRLVGFEFLVPDNLRDKLRSVGAALELSEAPGINAQTVAARNLTDALQAVSSDLNSESAELERYGRLRGRGLSLE